MPNVSVSYEEMRNAAKSLNYGKDEITQKLNELQKLVNSLLNGGFVTDSASKEFEGAYAEFNKGAAGTINGLEGIAKYLTTAATTFETADTELSAKLRGGK